MTDVSSPHPAPPSSGPPRPRRRPWLTALKLGCLAVLLLPVAGGAALMMPGPLRASATVIVPHGAHSADIAGALATPVSGGPRAVWVPVLFRAAAHYLGHGTLKAGEYLIPARASMVDILDMMEEGRSVVRLFTVPEGLTSWEIAQRLNAAPVMTGALTAAPAEGSLWPESYRYNYGDSREGMVARMRQAMQDHLAAIWAGRDPNAPLQNPAELVTLASIIEKETAKPDERPRIAGVFANRLRARMKLQSDPTVIYALSQGTGMLGRAVTHDDLALASPFNTYVAEALPPQPICNPGGRALEAAAHPEANGFLYFVADGSGGHAFAADLAGQDRNINRWHALQAQKAAAPGAAPAQP